MNSENKNEFETNDITKNTEIKSVKNECENTGKIWKRNCPKCNNILYYNYYSNFWTANKKNNICIYCHNKNQKKIRYSENWTKPCIICGNILKYKTEKSFLYSIKHKNKCKSCQNNLRKNREFRNCIVCKKSFECTKKSKQKFCSTICHYNSGLQKHKRKIKYCKFCNKKIYYLDWEIKYHPKLFCSRKCNYSYQVQNGFKIKTKPEIKMENILKKYFSNIKYNFEVCGKFYDFYIPEKNLLLEIDGIYWHGKGLSNKELNETQIYNRKNDDKKTCIAKKMGYNLIRIWEDEIDENHVSKYFL